MKATHRRSRYPKVVIKNLTASGVGFSQFLGGHPVRILNTVLQWRPGPVCFARWYAN